MAGWSLVLAAACAGTALPPVPARAQAQGSETLERRVVERTAELSVRESLGADSEYAHVRVVDEAFLKLDTVGGIGLDRIRNGRK